MSTAEWGVALGIVGSITGTGSLFWRMFEWWMARRVRVRVMGSVGVVAIAPKMGQYLMYYDPQQAPTHIMVTVVNKGRDITIQQVGFQVPGEPAHLMLHGQPGQLPKRIARGEAETVWANLDEVFEGAVRRASRLAPYCKDSEQRTHRGSVDRHFLTFAKFIRARAVNSSRLWIRSRVER